MSGPIRNTNRLLVRLLEDTAPSSSEGGEFLRESLNASGPSAFERPGPLPVHVPVVFNKMKSLQLFVVTANVCHSVSTICHKEAFEPFGTSLLGRDLVRAF